VGARKRSIIRGSITLLEFALAVFLLGACGVNSKPVASTMAVVFDGESLRLLGEVDCFDGADLFALAAQQAVVNIEHRLCGTAVENGTRMARYEPRPRSKALGTVIGTFVLALAAARAFGSRPHSAAFAGRRHRSRACSSFTDCTSQ
jgi:hypothetical protein